MPTDRSGEPQPSRRGFTRLRTPLLIAGGAAIALGLGLGLLVRPNFAARDSDVAERGATPMQVEIDHTAPPLPPVESGGKLEVLPPDLAGANRQAGDASLSALTSQPVPETLAPDAAFRPGPPTDQAGPMRPGADCGGAGSLAEQMVCSDSDLAAVDREMSRAYRRALRAEISPDALRADQRDWLGVREEAARHSRRALAQVYQQRIAELNSAAEDAPAAER